MAEKKKKKKQPKGMPSGSIQSRMPSSTNTGKSPKKAVKKKRSLMERINPFDKESKERRAAKKRMKAGKKAVKAGKKIIAGKKAKGTGMVSTKKSRAKAIGAKAGTKVRRGAVKKVSTKGGDFVKYEKKSKAAGSFRAAFKSNCSGGAKSFTWDGRSYSCKKK